MTKGASDGFLFLKETVLTGGTEKNDRETSFRSEF